LSAGVERRRRRDPNEETSEMKSLIEMSVGELRALKAEVDEALRQQFRAGRPAEGLQRFWFLIDDTLAAKGA
jgi:hypothetical protein